MKTVAILGGSGGLGKKVSRLFNLPGENYKVIPLSSKDLDVTNYAACQQFCMIVQPDIIINLSGVNFDKFIHKLGYNDQMDVAHTLDVNIRGTVNIVSACLPGMRERGYGRIILTSSVLSTKNVMGTALYSGCKAFIDRFVKSISLENASKGITANSIQLGYFNGGLTDKLNDPEKFKQEIPLKRWGTIEELYYTIDWMIKTEYLTGANIALNGGL